MTRHAECPAYHESSKKILWPGSSSFVAHFFWHLRTKCGTLSHNMWLQFIHKWRRINHSSDPSYRLTSSTTWHLLPLLLNHLNDKQSCPFSFLHSLIWTELWPASSYQSSDSNFGPSFISTLFYLIRLSTINNTVWKYMLS